LLSGQNVILPIGGYSMYKLGDWLKNIHTGQVIEIIEVISNSDGIHQYVVKKSDRNPMYTTGATRVNYTVLLENYELLKLARLLYYNNAKAVTNGKPS
jgi:hypothetical protein